MNTRNHIALAASFGIFAVPFAVAAELAVSANDNKVTLVNGVVKVVENPPPDTVTIIDLKRSPPKVVAEIEAPASVVGPPLSVALTPDESLALVTAAMKIDPADATKQTPDNRLSVIDLKSTPPKVITQLEAGKGAAGVSINRQGTLALVANRSEGTISVYTIEGKTVAPVSTLTLGDAKTGVSHVAISPDGKLALATRDAEDRISVLSIDGSKVEYTKRDIYAGLRPYAIDIAKNGAAAVVGNIGRGNGDNDTLSLIDLTAKPPRVVDTVSTGGQSPEGVKLSPDGSIAAVVLQDGSNKPKESPFYNDHGRLVLFRVNGKHLAKLAEAPLGHWPQGAAFSADGKRILVGNMVERNLQVFTWDGKRLRDTGQAIPVNGGSAAVRTAEK